MIDAESTVLVDTHAAPATPNDTLQTHFGEDRALLNQVERILHSEELRESGVQRRLLKFLAEKSVSGEANELKEYTIAIDGLGRSASYDPRRNSAIRTQVGRLRQKLADYYYREGQGDRVIIYIPKGRYKLKYEVRDALPPAQSSTPAKSEAAEPAVKRGFSTALIRFRIPVVISAGVLLALAVGATYNWLMPAKTSATSTPYPTVWNADMEDLWQPFVAADRPTIVAIEDPLFIELDGKKGEYYHDKTLNSWQDVTSSPTVRAMRGALKNREIALSRYYTPFGEVDASLLIAKSLVPRIQNLSLAKASDLSMRALEENNVVFIGIERVFFADKIQAANIEVLLEPIKGGIRNVQPGPGEPAMFTDQYSAAPKDEGIAYALVSHVPGPLGGNYVEGFTSSRSAGYVAAVKAFTDPPFVHELVGKLKQAGGGHMPRYYQVLLRVKFRAEEPTEITYVLARELHYPRKS